MVSLFCNIEEDILNRDWFLS